jgi:hypothetical protein
VSSGKDIVMESHRDKDCGVQKDKEKKINYDGQRLKSPTPKSLSSAKIFKV